MIKLLGKEQYDEVLGSQAALRKASEWASEAQRMIREGLMPKNGRDVLGALFDVEQDKLGASITTPFGRARAIAVNAIVDGRVQVRYIFEKLVTLNSGSDEYVPIGEIRIDKGGVVTAEDGKQLAALNTFDESESFRAMTEIGISVIHAIASHERYHARVV